MLNYFQNIYFSVAYAVVRQHFLSWTNETISAKYQICLCHQEANWLKFFESWSWGHKWSHAKS